MKIKKTKRTYQLTMSHDEFEALALIVRAGESEWMSDPTDEIGSLHDLHGIADRSKGVQHIIENTSLSAVIEQALK